MFMAITHNSSIYANLKKILLSENTLKRHSLSIDKLSQQLNASSIPVREALIRLAAEDLIDYEKGKGFYTKDMTLKSIEYSYQLLYLTVRWSINYYSSEQRCCKKLLEWIYSDSLYFEKILQDHKLFESTICYTIMCISGNERFYFINNIIKRTSHFRRVIHNKRTDITETIGYIMQLAEHITNGNTPAAVEILNKMEDCRMRLIPQEYEQLTNQQLDFPSISDYIDS